MLLQKSNNCLSNYSLTNPVKSDGTLTNYGKMLMLEFNKPADRMYDRHDFISAALDTIGETYNPGFCSGTFAMLNLNDLISYNSSTRTLSAGKNLNEYVNTYILPFIKA